VQPGPQTNVGWKETFIQPAKQAERVLAPGDGEAEPGVTATNFREPAKLATDGGWFFFVMKTFESGFSLVSSVAHFVGLDVGWVRFPRLGFAIAWG
jgi:hypothetical protein